MLHHLNSWKMFCFSVADCFERNCCGYRDSSAAHHCDLQARQQVQTEQRSNSAATLATVRKQEKQRKTTLEICHKLSDLTLFLIVNRSLRTWHCSLWVQVLMSGCLSFSLTDLKFSVIQIGRKYVKSNWVVFLRYDLQTILLLITPLITRA